MTRYPRTAALLVCAIAVALLAPIAADMASARVTRFQPTREWNIDAILADGTRAGLSENPIPPPVGGRLEEVVDAGSTSDIDDEDGRASPRVFASPSGVTYGSFAQTPNGSVGNPESPLGNVSRLVQYQKFRKDDANATLSYKVTHATIDMFDTNGDLEPRFPECPVTNRSFGTCDGAMEGQLIFSIRAYRGQRTFYQAAGGAKVDGWQGHFDDNQWVESFSTDHLWSESDFFFQNEDPGIEARMGLFDPLSREIDISRIPVGTTFTVRSDAITSAYNRRTNNGDDLHASVDSFLQDPLATGGRLLENTGLTRLGNPQLETPPDPTPEPAECDAGADPNVGTLQFSEAESDIGEWSGAGPQVFVTRTGGSTGPVSATVTSTDGTALAGSDYSAVSTTVRFEADDTTPRPVHLPIVEDLVAEEDETLTLTLSEPACTTLGALVSDVVTIADDDRSIVAESFTLGGTVNGLEGSGLELSNFGERVTVDANGEFTFPIPLGDGFTYDVQVASQPSDPEQTCTVTNGEGTIVSADVTDVAIECITPPPDSDLDATFGGDGRVTSPGVPSGGAVALDSEGRIVVAGGRSLTRYETDGDLDPTFGDQGRVTTGLDDGFLDDAADVAIQPDGRIVVAGIVDGIEDDFGIERYEASGAPDLSFGTQGRVTKDFNGGTDIAYGVAIDRDDNIVVAGHATDAAGTGNDFAVARYTNAGIPDVTFDGDGFVTTDIEGVGDFAKALALQSDGRILVGGRVSNSPFAEHFAVVRYEANGQVDTSFGEQGVALGAIAGSAHGIVVQPDDKIVVAIGEVGDFALARFDGQGIPDAGFGDEGIVRTDFGNLSGPIPATEFAHELALQADGSIVVVGVDEFSSDWAIVRYDDGGDLDGSFADGGILTVDFTGGFDSAFDVVVQPDGKIVTVGSARSGFGFEAGLVRINP